MYIFSDFHPVWRITLLKRFLDYLIGPVTPATPSPYQEAIARFEALVAPEIEVRRNLRQVQSLCPTLDVYIVELGRIIDAFNREVLYVPVHAGEPRAVRLFALYLDKDGHFADIEETHRRFVKASIQLLTIYEEKEASTDQSGLLQANLHRSLAVINNLVYLSAGLQP